MPTRGGSFRLFKLAGITVYLHWTWFLVAVYAVQFRTGVYSSHLWNVLEYLSLFLIVLLHEFGHQLACRSVGGATHDIVLWPLGGVAYVTPPQRPGAQLWSIAAGPLVNVALIPVLTLFLLLLGGYPNLQGIEPNEPAYLLNNIWFINLGLLIFNLMPVYPLDGGQILRSLLWFVLGRANSLLVASVIGFVGVAGLILLALLRHSLWLGVMAAFILMNCWGGLTQARALARIARLPRRNGFLCPVCHVAPPAGAVWRCGQCGRAFDPFETLGTCPHCSASYAAMSCPECGSLRPLAEWERCGQVPPVIDV
jgi:Zn-dependent protease/DNA-directed RNA polymerase subunit RPC12/RpoP